MGNTEVLTRGDVQFTSAGRGIMHSEFNAKADEDVHFLQIWYVPSERDTEPRYTTKKFPDESKHGKLVQIVSKDGADGSIKIGADTRVFATLLSAGETVAYDTSAARRAYLHVPETPGSQGIVVNGETRLKPGDGAFIEESTRIELTGNADDGTRAEAILFDLA
mmetsp:Transcript_108741/g.264377  ORF Transcript_108741/g.264377 Transcript_108741/m.264377 type:complete len:164 (-) Transcript_108741:1969-2460(-)